MSLAIKVANSEQHEVTARMSRVVLSCSECGWRVEWEKVGGPAPCRCRSSLGCFLDWFPHISISSSRSGPALVLPGAGSTSVLAASWENMGGIQQLVRAQSVSAILIIKTAGCHSSRKLQSLGFVYLVERKQRSFTDRGKKSHTG